MFQYKLKFKRLSDSASTPYRGSTEAAGYDLFSAEDITISPHTTQKVHTQIAIELPNGTFGAIFARSGIAVQRALRPANCVGVIDSDYRGEIIIALHNDSDVVQGVVAGERIAQLVILPYFAVDLEEVDELSDTARGSGGFASTGMR